MRVLSVDQNNKYNLQLTLLSFSIVYRILFPAAQFAKWNEHAQCINYMHEFHLHFAYLRQRENKKMANK